jgi:signal transduction histidine kinase
MSAADFPRHRGRIASKMRQLDWSTTPLGPVGGWSTSLRSAAETVLSGTFPMVLCWGPEHVVCAYNDAYGPLLGQREDFLGLSFVEVWAEAREIVAPQMDRALQGEACFFEGATFTLMRHGHPEQAHFDYSFSPVRDDDGTVRGVLNVAVETTRRVLAERAQRVAVERLEEKVAERTAELERQKARLQRLTHELAVADERARKHLAALLHDHLQQYLVGLKMQLAAARRSSDEKASIALDEGLRLVEQAMAVSRDLTHELRPPVLYEDGLAPALDWLASRLAERHGLEVTVDAEELSAPLREDARAMMFECARELLLNVAKHADTERATVSIDAQTETMRLTVSDGGVGFDVEELARRDDGRAGWGLLSIANRVETLGGRVEIDARPGEGSAVSLELPWRAVLEDGARGPFERAPAVRPQGALPLERAGPAAPRVLVVDDHAVVRQGLVTLISQDERIRVVGEADDGLAALDAVERHQPDVVLMDVNLPGISGVEATKRIRQRWPWIEVVGLSVQDDARTHESMRQAGAKAFVSKSDDAETMVTAILSNR